MWMPDKACVSTSSVKNTFVTPSSLISTCPLSAMLRLLFAFEVCLFQSNPVVCVVRRHVRQNHLIADFEAREDFHRVDRAAAQLDLRALGVDAVGIDLEQPDDALFLTEGGAAHVEDVVEP